MYEVLETINKTFKGRVNEATFEGNVYFFENDRLEVERETLHRIIKKYNAACEANGNEWRLDLNSHLWLVFVYEVFEDNSERLTRLDRNYYLSTIIHENGFWSIWSEETEGYDKKPDHFDFLAWNDIDAVDLMENKEDNTFFFRFFIKNIAEHFDMSSNRFGAFDHDTCTVIEDLLIHLVWQKNQKVIDSENKHSEFQSSIEEQCNNENYEEAIDLLENFYNHYQLGDISNENTDYYYLFKTICLIRLEQFEEALKNIDSYIKKYIEINSEVPPYAYELKGEVLLKTNNLLPAINFLATSAEGYEEMADKGNAIALKEESYSKLKEVFLEVPFNQRKLIFIGNEIYATQSSGMAVLKINDLPPNVHFPVGHPHINEVYTCHPHKMDFYLPLKSYSEELFLDRIHEFSWLLQCLGASTLEISSSKNDSSDQTKTSKTGVDAKLDYKVSGVKVNYKGENSDSTSIDDKLNIAKKQVFKPNKAPFVPADLVWYQSNTSWQRLANQRLNGSIMMHSELISSSQSETISSHELKQVEADLKFLLPKLGVKYNGEEQLNTSSVKKLEWMVNVEFSDVNDLLHSEQHNQTEPAGRLNSGNDSHNSNLEKYKEDVLLMIEDDGIIDEFERNILNRKIKKYGLSEEDARAIENELATSVYSENELNYIQELKEFLEDGAITEKERKILDRYAEKFGVAMDVQKRLDAIFIL